MKKRLIAAAAASVFAAVALAGTGPSTTLAAGNDWEIRSGNDWEIRSGNDWEIGSGFVLRGNDWE